jgi:hypothetical protein
VKRRKYRVTTWDPAKEGFTPQPGVRAGPYTQFALRKALRKLRNLGYDTDRNAPSIYVEETTDQAAEELAKELTEAMRKINHD